MNRDVCEHFTPAGIPCIKCQTSPRLEKAMFPKRYAECKVDGNEVLCHSDRVLLAMSEYESELASLRQKQVLWEAGNRELADRLEARDVAIDALRAEKERAEETARELISLRDMLILCGEEECRDVQGYPQKLRALIDGLIVMRRKAERAEAERDEAIRMRDRHAEASKAQNEDITALMAERDAALKDAALWRKHSDVVKATYVPGALHVRVTMSAEASRTEKCWQVEYVISTDEMESGVLKNHIIGMKTEQKVAELFAAIDAARKGQQ